MPPCIPEYLDGWLLRHCDLLNRKRSNSALPPDTVVDPVDADQVEKFHLARAAKQIIHLSPLDLHVELDAALAERGYRAVAPTTMMVASGRQLAAATEDCAGARRVFLQVEDDNLGARKLCASIGFQVSHSYHYRVV